VDVCRVRRPWHSTLEEIGFDEDQEAEACKTCSRCQAKMQSLGRLKGRETLEIIRLADGIDERLAERTPLPEAGDDCGIDRNSRACVAIERLARSHSQHDERLAHGLRGAQCAEGASGTQASILHALCSG
jgi:hypothetical protein